MDIPPTSPRQIRCPNCRAQPYTACKRIKPGRKVQIGYLKGFHAARRAELKHIQDLTFAASTDEVSPPEKQRR